MLIFYIRIVHFYKRKLEYLHSSKVYFLFFALATTKTKISASFLHTLDPESFDTDCGPKLISELLWLVHVLLMAQTKT